MSKSKKGNSRVKVNSELLFREDQQQYAIVTKLLGDSRISLKCYDEINRIGLIRGTMKKRVWISVGDLVLVTLREFEDQKCDIIHKYNQDEARILQAMGELPINTKSEFQNDQKEVEDSGFDFETI